MPKPPEINRPEPHGLLIAESYQQAFAVGQLAASYVIRHYLGGSVGFRERIAPPSEHHKQILSFLVQGLTAGEEALERGVTPKTAANQRALVYGDLRVSGQLPAARRAIEEGLVIVAARPQLQSPTFDTFDLAVFDLYTRGLTERQVGRLTGERPRDIQSRVARFISDLAVPRHRRTLAVTRMYELGVFQPPLGLISTLTSFPHVIEEFDQKLGRNQPFINPQPPLRFRHRRAQK